MNASNAPDSGKTPSASEARAPATMVCDLQKGDRVDRVFLLENANFKATRNNKHFIQADIRDRTGSIKALRWEADRKLFSSFRPADFVHVRGRVEEFQQHLQIIIDAIEKVSDDEVEIDLFLPTSTKDIDALWSELRETIASFDDPDYRRLLEVFLEDEEVARGLRRCPAGRVLHHAWIGGLLEHIVSLSHVAEATCKNYPQLNRDLLLSGVILHDIGKLRELSYDRVFSYTDVGQLVGHIAIGVTWVQEMSRRIPNFPDAKLMQVQHLIASHHGEPEFDAIKRPMTQEAIALHAIDNLDAKLTLMDSVKREQGLGGPGGEEWSDYHPALARRVYFPRD